MPLSCHCFRSAPPCTIQMTLDGSDTDEEWALKFFGSPSAAYVFGTCAASRTFLSAALKCHTSTSNKDACTAQPYCDYVRVDPTYQTCELGRLEPLVSRDAAIFTSDPWGAALASLTAKCMPLLDSNTGRRYGSRDCREYRQSPEGRQGLTAQFDAVTQLQAPGAPLNPANLRPSFYVAPDTTPDPADQTASGIHSYYRMYHAMGDAVGGGIGWGPSTGQSRQQSLTMHATTWLLTRLYRARARLQVQPRQCGWLAALAQATGA